MNVSYEWVRRAGETLFGTNWRTPLAQALGITRHSVYCWNPAHPQNRAIQDTHYLHIRHLLAMQEHDVPIEIE